mgnify:CR=1 FL=1|tara:strand:+ start:141 stop:692 length:552 start_codon:yes stop_codon:yes gene_type:complete
MALSTIGTNSIADDAVTAVKASGLGITMADTWRLTTQFTTTDGTSFRTITANLERDDSTGYGVLGSGMSQSSGIFTFPSTGIYLITANFFAYDDADFAYFEGFIRTTTDNSSYTTRTQSSLNVQGRSSGSPEGNTHGECLFDVTNTSTHKCSFGFLASTANVLVLGNSGYNATYFTFTRLGDT